MIYLLALLLEAFFIFILLMIFVRFKIFIWLLFYKLDLLLWTYNFGSSESLGNQALFFIREGKILNLNDVVV